MIFVDSNIWIFSSIEEYPEYQNARLTIMELLRKGERFGVNSIIVSEIFHKVCRLTGWDKARRVTQKILSSPKVIFVSIELGTVLRAVNLARARKMRINDAMIAQHAMDSKAEGILTDNVKDFKKISGLHVVSLR